MKIKSLFRDSMKLNQSAFSIRPKGFNSVDMLFAPGKFISTMMHSIMLFITQIHQAVITSPLVRMDDAIWRDTTSYYCLQRCFGAIWHYLGIDFPPSLKNTKNYSQKKTLILNKNTEKK